LRDVAEPGQAVLPPPVSPRPRVIVRQVTPRVAVGAVVLPDRAPLALADVRPPPVPIPRLQQAVLQPAESVHPLTFGAHGRPLRAPGVPRCLCRSWHLAKQSPAMDES